VGGEGEVGLFGRHLVDLAGGVDVWREGIVDGWVDVGIWKKCGCFLGSYVYE
jgi:hypothetical protein